VGVVGLGCCVLTMTRTVGVLVPELMCKLCTEGAAGQTESFLECKFWEVKIVARRWLSGTGCKRIAGRR